MSAVLAQRFSPAIWPVRVLGLGLMCLLAACSPKESERQPAAASAQPALSALPVLVELRQQSCAEDCARFSAKWLRFPEAPSLDEVVLKDQGVTWQGGVEASLQFAAKDFMSDAERRWESLLSLSQKPAALPGLVVLEAANYSYTGGAHGQDVFAFYNWDARQRKLVGLRDWLLPEQGKAFWARVQQAHAQWAARGKPNMIESGWPFVRSENIALLPDGLAIRYNAYEIGPHSEGAPLLRVPYASLRGIFKPEWLPAP